MRRSLSTTVCLFSQPFFLTLIECKATFVLRLQVFHDQVVQFTDAGAAAGNAVVTFETLSLVAPRGRFDVEMYMSSLKLTGQVSNVYMELSLHT